MQPVGHDVTQYSEAYSVEIQDRRTSSGENVTNQNPPATGDPRLSWKDTAIIVKDGIEGGFKLLAVPTCSSGLLIIGKLLHSDNVSATASMILHHFATSEKLHNYAFAFFLSGALINAGCRHAVRKGWIWSPEKLNDKTI